MSCLSTEDEENHKTYPDRRSFSGNCNWKAPDASTGHFQLFYSVSLSWRTALTGFVTSVFQTPVTVCSLGVGATFGESILQDLPRDSTVVTRSTCELLRVEQQDFKVIWEVSHTLPFASSRVHTRKGGSRESISGDERAEVSCNEVAARFRVQPLKLSMTCIERLRSHPRDLARASKLASCKRVFIAHSFLCIPQLCKE
jgi:CRP-like cAMP-binding protein